LSERLASSSAFQSTLREDGAGVSTDRVRFAVAQVAIAFVVGAVPTALLAGLMYLWLARVQVAAWPRLVVALGYALLTPAFAYANTLYGHQLAAFLLFAAFFGLSTARRFSLGAAALIGFLLAYTVVTEYPMALVVGVLWLYALWRFRAVGQIGRIVPLTLVASLVAAGWMAYNNAVFGGPLNLGYSYSEQWVTQHSTGFVSLTRPGLCRSRCPAPPRCGGSRSGSSVGCSCLHRGCCSACQALWSGGANHAWIRLVPADRSGGSQRRPWSWLPCSMLRR